MVFSTDLAMQEGYVIVAIHYKTLHGNQCFSWNTLDSFLELNIRPHRFGGEGVLIGAQFGYTKCSCHTCLYSSRYISFSWRGGHLKFSRRNPSSAVVFVIFRTILGVGSEKGIEMEFWVVLGGSGNRKTDLGGFRQRKNGQQWKKTANTDVFKGFGMLENWTHCKNQCFGPILYRRTRKLCCFWRKDWNNTARTCVLDRLYAQKCKNYMGVEGKQSKNIAKNKLKQFNIFTRTEPKNLRCGRPPTRSGVNRHIDDTSPTRKNLMTSPSNTPRNNHKFALSILDFR